MSADAGDRDRPAPVGADERGGAGEREARRGMLDLRVGRGRARGGSGKRTSTSSSPGASAVRNGPTKNSSAATVRSPLRRAKRRARAPSASTTAGMSDAGSACTRLPPSVPRLRTWRSPIVACALARSPRAPGRVELRQARSSALPGRERADTSRWPSSRLAPPTASPPMSTSSEGRTTRSFRTGRSDCPPASTFASGSASASNASSNVARADVLDRRRDHARSPSAAPRRPRGSSRRSGWYPVQRQ